jgi:hypothetical protein
MLAELERLQCPPFENVARQHEGIAVLVTGIRVSENLARSSSPYPARSAASLTRASAVPWPTEPSISSSTCCPPCPFATGSARCPGGCASCSATSGASAPRSPPPRHRAQPLAPPPGPSTRSPSTASGRLERRDDGPLALSFKNPWKDGSALVLEPDDLIGSARCDNLVVIDTDRCRRSASREVGTLIFGWSRPRRRHQSDRRSRFPRSGR